MVFWKVEDLVNHTIDEEEVSQLQSKYPYFSLPFILEWIKKSPPDKSFQDISRFKPNAVLLYMLENKYRESALSDTDPTIKNIDNNIVTGQDYYTMQGIKISDELPEKDDLQDLIIEHESTLKEHDSDDSLNEKSLLVQMSFNEWLSLITNKKQKEQEEFKEQEELKNNWKKRKLAEAIEEESDDIPEEVFKMAVDSIEKEEVVSESIAEVYILQGKHEQAINIYKKLILQNPEKKVYFASKIDIIRNNYNL